MKANSSRWMSAHASSFEWQQGYGAFAVSASLLGATARYSEQPKHHKHRGFDEEFLALLKKYQIPHDPNDVFD